MSDSEKEREFDFKAHEQAAVAKYLTRLGFYGELSRVVKRILEESLKRRGIKVHSVEARAKDPTSFGRKAGQPSEADPTKPRYQDPLKQITHLAGVRIIAYFPSTLAQIDELLGGEFKIVERSDKGAELIEEDRVGYQSIHYLVELTPERARLPEYGPFGSAVAEIQIRTIMQHAGPKLSTTSSTSLLR